MFPAADLLLTIHRLIRLWIVPSRMGAPTGIEKASQKSPVHIDVDTIGDLRASVGPRRLIERLPARPIAVSVELGNLNRIRGHSFPSSSLGPFRSESSVTALSETLMYLHRRTRKPGTESETIQGSPIANSTRISPSRR